MLLFLDFLFKSIYFYLRVIMDWIIEVVNIDSLYCNINNCNYF